jgi:hypothetical protein
VLQPAYASLESLRRTAPTSRSRPPRGGSVHARGPLWSHSGVIGPGVWRSSRNGCARVPGPQERILGLQEIEWAILIARAAGTRMDTALPGPGPVNVLRLAPAHRDLRPTISSPSPRRGHRRASVVPLPCADSLMEYSPTITSSYLTTIACCCETLRPAPAFAGAGSCAIRAPVRSHKPSRESRSQACSSPGTRSR